MFLPQFLFLINPPCLAASELLLYISTWCCLSQALQFTCQANYITHLYEEAESTRSTWLAAEHMLKRDMYKAIQTDVYGYWSRARKRKVMYIVCIARAPGPIRDHRMYGMHRCFV